MIAVKNLLGPHPNKNFTNKKVFKTHQSDVQHVERLKRLAWTMVADEEAEQDNHLRLPVLNVAKRTQCLFNQEETDQFSAEIVSEPKERDNS